MDIAVTEVASTGHALSDELRKALISQIASEIQDGAETIKMLRTRNAFTIWVGPYVVFGSVVVAVKGGFAVNVGSGWFVGALVFAAICYLALAHLGGMIERYTLSRSNSLRRCIASVANDGALDMGLYIDEELPRAIVRAYWAVFATLLACFFGVVILVSTIEPKAVAGTPSVPDAVSPIAGESSAKPPNPRLEPTAPAPK